MTKGGALAHHIPSACSHLSGCRHPDHYHHVPVGGATNGFRRHTRLGDPLAAPQARRAGAHPGEPERNNHLHAGRRSQYAIASGEKVTGYHYVRTYARSDGTRVRGHRRRNPSRGAGGVGALLAVLLMVAVLHGCANDQAGIRSANRARIPGNQPRSGVLITTHNTPKKQWAGRCNSGPLGSRPTPGRMLGPGRPH